MLESIRSTWLTRVSHKLAQGEGVRESFLLQLERFYDLLEQAVETGNPSWLEPVLTDWVGSRTTSDLETHKSSISPIINYLLLTTFELFSECFNEKDALNLLSVILPVFIHAFEFSTKQETGLHVEHISSELQKVTEALEKLDKSKSDFIAVAAHELRTPLTLIEGYTSMLREMLSPDLQQSVAGIYLKGIDTGSNRMREIVNDMIDVSMIDNSLLSINFQPVWLNRLLVAVERELRGKIRERKQTLTIRSFPGNDALTYGDGERLLQALRNLVTNAMKYTPDGGKIEIDGRLLPGFIEVTVSDTGIGIDPEDHVRIFEKFGGLGNTSLHSSSKTMFKGGGPGLGLSITKGIIEAHGGAIWVESEGYDEVKCPGSIFHVLLPLRKDAPEVKTGRLFQPDQRK